MRFLAKPKRASSLWSYGLTKSFHIFCVEFYIFYCLLQRYIKKIEYLRPVTQEKIKSKTIFVKRRLRYTFPEYTNSVLHGCIQQSAWLKITNGQNGFTRNGVRVSTRIRNFNRRTGIDCINRSVSSMTAVSTKAVGFESCVY